MGYIGNCGGGGNGIADPAEQWGPYNNHGRGPLYGMKMGVAADREISEKDVRKLLPDPSPFSYEDVVGALTRAVKSGAPAWKIMGLYVNESPETLIVEINPQGWKYSVPMKEMPARR